MLDLSKLLKTQYDEFVALLTGLDIMCIPACILKTKFGHLQAIIEHERLLRSVATVCDKRNKKKQDEIIYEICKKPNEDTWETNCDQDDTVGSKCGQAVGNKSEQDDSKSELECHRDSTVDNEFKWDGHKTKTNCNQYDIIDNECKQDDCKSMENCHRDTTVDSGCKMDDCKPKVDCNQDDYEYEQDDGKPELSCGRDDDIVGKECKQHDRKPKTKHRFTLPHMIFGGSGMGLDGKPELSCGRDDDNVGKECEHDDRKPKTKHRFMSPHDIIFGGSGVGGFGEILTRKCEKSDLFIG